MEKFLITTVKKKVFFPQLYELHYATRELAHCEYSEEVTKYHSISLETPSYDAIEKFITDHCVT